MSLHDATAPLCFAPPTTPAVPLLAAFDADPVTSDGGLPWLGRADAALGLCATLGAVIPDWRRRAGRHSVETLLRQRLFQIACGHEDQNDATTLRHDPLLQLVCGRVPTRGAAGEASALASQPTLSRFENALDWRTCYRLAYALAGLYVQQRGQGGPPRHLLLEVDTTDDPAHGQQEGVHYHGYYRQHMYHPLLIFDGDTHHLITAVLRPGKAHASRGAVRVLHRLVTFLRQQWPQVTFEVRADSGFATPAVYRYCQTHGLAYTIGLVPNPRLRALGADLQAEATQQRATTGVEKVRLLGEFPYQAQSWAAPQRVVVKAEALVKGPNTRFVVTTRTDPPAEVYRFYTQRGGDAEGPIYDLKCACFADRLSCHRFVANQGRLLLHAAVYVLLHTLRTWLVQAGHPPLHLDTLRLRLLKVGAIVRRRLHDVRLALSASHPAQPLWRLLARHIGCS